MILFDTNVLLRVLLSDRGHPRLWCKCIQPLTGERKELLTAGGFVSSAIMS